MLTVYTRATTNTVSTWHNGLTTTKLWLRVSRHKRHSLAGRGQVTEVIDRPPAKMTLYLGVVVDISRRGLSGEMVQSAQGNQSGWEDSSHVNPFILYKQRLLGKDNDGPKARPQQV